MASAGTAAHGTKLEKEARGSSVRESRARGLVGVDRQAGVRVIDCRRSTDLGETRMSGADGTSVQLLSGLTIRSPFAKLLAFAEEAASRLPDWAAAAPAARAAAGTMTMRLRTSAICATLLLLCSALGFAAVTEPAGLRASVKTLLGAVTSSNAAAIAPLLDPNVLVIADNGADALSTVLTLEPARALLVASLAARPGPASVERQELLVWGMMKEDPKGESVHLGQVLATIRRGDAREEFLAVLRRDGNAWKILLVAFGGVRSPATELSPPRDLTTTWEPPLLAYLMVNDISNFFEPSLLQATLADPDGRITCRLGAEARSGFHPIRLETIVELRSRTGYSAGVNAGPEFAMLGERLAIGWSGGLICPPGPTAHVVGGRQSVLLVRRAVNSWGAVALWEALWWCCPGGVVQKPK